MQLIFQSFVHLLADPFWTGDIRSRLVRLIPPASPSSPLDAIRGLLAFRLPMDDRQARDQWREIVEGKSSLWTGIPNDRKETIRGIIEAHK